MTLLLDRCGLGIALSHDQPAENSSMLAGNFLPYWLALVFTERNPAIGFGIRQKDAPSVVGHLYVSKCRPALCVGRGRGAQINIATLETFRPHLAPPIEEAGLPGLQRSLQPAIVGETHVVGNSFGIIDRH